MPTPRDVVHRTADLITAASMAVAAGVYFTRSRFILRQFRKLGYPDYFPILLGVFKVLGSAALVLPVGRRAKEWAYAGFAFTFASATVSQAATKHRAAAVAPVGSLAVLAVAYLTRPAGGGGRKTVVVGPARRLQ